MRRARLTAIATLAVASITLVACGREQPPQVGSTTIAAADRQDLPAISGVTLDGDELSLTDLRGKVVVLNSWATWCEPCRSEIPAFVDLADSVDPEDVAVIGLNVSDNTDAATQFVDEFSMTYPSIVDQDGTILPTVPGVPPAALPSTVIIDRDGRIAVRIIGITDATALPALVAEVAAE